MNKISIIIVSFISLLNIPQAKAIATGGWSRPSAHGLPDNFDDIGINIINWLLGLTITLSIIALIWGGITYVSSGGNQDLAQGAKRTIRYALIGLVTAGLAYALVNVAVTQIFT